MQNFSHRILAATAMLLSGIGAVSARPSLPVAYPTNPIVEVRCDRPDEANLTGHGCYVNRFGRDVHRPSRTYNGAPPKRATAQCQDGSYSFSQHASGTCSHHGGVASWR